MFEARAAEQGEPGAALPPRPGSAGGRERPATDSRCLRCGFPVVPKPWGCKHPCDNCGFIYPLGDCSD